MPSRRMNLHAAGLLLLTLLAGCGRAPTDTPTATSLSAPPVVTNMLDCTGTLRPARIFAVRPRPDEIVDEVLVKTGDQVQSGDVLGILSCPELQTQWLTAREKALSLRREAGQLDLCRRKKQVAESRLEELRKRIAVEESLRTQVAGYDPQIHARPLFDEKTRVEEEIQTLDQEIALGIELQTEAAPMLKSLEKQLKLTERRLASLTVRAPFAGTIVRADSAPDKADGVLVELQDRSQFTVRGMLWQNQLSVVRTDSRVTITPDFLPGESWTGTVDSIGFAPVAGSNDAFPRYPVIVTLDPGVDTTLLRDGMTVFMRIERATSNGQSP